MASSPPVGSTTTLPTWAAALLAGSPALLWPHRSVNASVVVIGRGAGELPAISRLAGEASAVVDREWRLPWSGRVLVVVPADRSQLAAVAGVAPGRLGAAAAMTISGPGKGSYILLDPAAWAQGTSDGRRALLIHETVHVAQAEAEARANAEGPRPGEQVPSWLREGFAQDVAYRAIGAEPRDIAPRLLNRIAREGPPSQLPDAVDLDGRGSTREDAYALAWFAVRTLRRIGGPHAARRAVQAGSLAATGISSDALRRAWQDDLRRLAGQR